MADAIANAERLQIHFAGMAIDLKDVCRKTKNYDDIFLLRQKDLVNRPKVKEIIIGVSSEDAWLATLPNFKRLCNLAKRKIDEPDKYYEED